MAQQTPRPAYGSDVALQARGGPVAPERRNGSAPDRSMTEIKDDIDTTRSRLAGTVDEIADRVKPKNVALRLRASAQAQVIDPATGTPRYERIGIVAGIVVLLVGVRVWRSRR